MAGVVRRLTAGFPLDPRTPVRAVVDTSSLVSSQRRRDLQQATQLGEFTAIWSPWIIAELNRVLVWRWIDRSGGELSRSNRRRCSEAAKTMMSILLPTFELVAPLPPFPPAWDTLVDAWDHPLWAAAKAGHAEYVVSENHRDYPPPTPDKRHFHEGIEYLPTDAFLALLNNGGKSPR